MQGRCLDACRLRGRRVAACRPRGRRVGASCLRGRRMGAAQQRRPHLQRDGAQLLIIGADQAGRAAFTCVMIAWNAAGSRTARSASIFRLTRMPASFIPWMKRL